MSLVPTPPSVPYPEDADSGGGGYANQKTNEAPADETEKRAWTRDKVAREILSTEQSYVASLCQVMECYITPLSANTKILSAQEVQTLFSNIQLLTTLNLKLLSDLEKRLAIWDTNPCLGDIFLSFAHFFKMYTQYVGNHDKATAILDMLNADRSKFKSFCEKALMEGKAKGTPLASYLIKPIQRIPRYKLLLEQMVKFTDPDHPDFSSSSKALELVADVALQVNEAVRQQQDRTAVIRIGGMFTTTENFVHPARYFIRHGPLMKKCRSSNKPYEFFLFNDLLLYCTQGTVGGKFNIRQRIEINQNFDVKDEPDAGGLKNLWSIISSTKSFTAFCDDPAVKASWLKDLGKCVEEAQKRVDRNAKTTDMKQPVWISDDLAKDCAVCKKSFGVFRGKHHCRYCGNVICDDCSKERMILGPKKPDAVAQRVCDQCVSKLKKSQAEKDQQMTALMLSAIAPKKNEEVKLNNSAHHLDLMQHNRGAGASTFNSLAPPPGARQPRRSLSQGAIKVPAHIQAIRPGGTANGNGSATPSTPKHTTSKSPPARAPAAKPTLSKASSMAPPEKPAAASSPHRVSWVELMSPEGHAYYQNNETGETTWNKPLDMLMAERGSKASPWVEMYTEDGYAYYMNIQTQESSWERPADYDGPISEEPGAAAASDEAADNAHSSERLSTAAEPPSLTSVMDNSTPELPKATATITARPPPSRPPPSAAVSPPAAPSAPSSNTAKRAPPAAPSSGSASTPSTPNSGPKPPPRAMTNGKGAAPPLDLSASASSDPKPALPPPAKKFAPPSRTASAMPTLTETAAPTPAVPPRKAPPAAPAAPPSIITKAPPPKPTTVSSPTTPTPPPITPTTTAGAKKPPPRANTDGGAAPPQPAGAKKPLFDPRTGASTTPAAPDAPDVAPEPPARKPPPAKPKTEPPAKPVPAAPAAPAEEEPPKLPPRAAAPAMATVKVAKTNSAVAAMNAALLDKETKKAAPEPKINSMPARKPATAPPAAASSGAAFQPSATPIMPAVKRDSTPALPPRKHGGAAATPTAPAAPAAPTPTPTAAAAKPAPKPFTPVQPKVMPPPAEKRDSTPALPPRVVKAAQAQQAAQAAASGPPPSASSGTGPKKFTPPSLASASSATASPAAASSNGAKPPPPRPASAGAAKPAAPPPRAATTASGGKQLRAPPPVPTDDEEWQD